MHHRYSTDVQMNGVNFVVHLGAGNVLELDLDDGHTAVYNIKIHPTD